MEEEFAEPERTQVWAKFWSIRETSIESKHSKRNLECNFASHTRGRRARALHLNFLKKKQSI